MADQSDVENALVGLTANALYPSGTAAASIPGPDCLIYRGWPNAAALDNDLAAGRINVSVFPMPEPGRNTTRYRPKPSGSAVQPSITVTVYGVTVTIGGTSSASQLVGVLVDEVSYAYRTQATDTPDTIAANLATLMRVNRLVTLSGASLTVPGAGHILARAVADSIILQEIRRQEQGFRITCWCPDPTTRDSTATAVDLHLAGYQFIVLGDGTSGRLRYRGTLVFDQSEDARLYRRDLIYDVEYATVVTPLQPAMLFGDLVLNAGTFMA